MLTLYSYPELFGVADNNGYGLKVFAFLRLAGVPFTHEQSSTPRRRRAASCLTSSTTARRSATAKPSSPISRANTASPSTRADRAQRDTDHLITRMLDDLYWVMSYSRWKDERYWPAFRDALMREHPSLTDEGLLKAREFNSQRYHFQGIGRYEPDAPRPRHRRSRGAGRPHPGRGYLHGPQPTSIDAGIYGFIANIYFYESTRR